MVNDYLKKVCELVATSLDPSVLTEKGLGCLVGRNQDEIYDILSKHSRVTVTRWDSYDNLVGESHAKDVFDMASDFRGSFILGEIEDAIRDEIRKNKYSFSGDYHGHGKTGVPVFQIEGYTGEYFYATSARAWGSIMADVWGGDYMDFYCGTRGEAEKCVP